MPTSAQWRINVSVSNDPTYVGIAKLTMHAISGGADLCTGGTASASNFSPGFGAALAFDASTSTYWSSVGSVFPSQLQYTFAAPVTIVAYSVQAQNAASYTPKTWTFEWFDGSTWQIFDTQTNQTGWRASGIRTYPIYPKQQWRLSTTVTQASSVPTFVEFSEIQLRTAIGGANQATVGLKSSSISFNASGQTADFALDSNAATFFCTTSGGSGAKWWMYWFDGPINIIEYMIQAGPGTDGQYAPKTWTLEYWDGTTWIVADTRTSQPNWTTNETRTFTVPTSGGGGGARIQSIIIG